MSKIYETLRSYELHEIYNVDETALYYKLLPRRTYVTEFEDPKNIRGTQKMKAKDRATAFICANADRIQKVLLTLIGKSKNPRAFKNNKLPCYYYNTKKLGQINICSKSGLTKFFRRMY